ncbi:MAG: RNA-binding S4 domain-containing protein [Acholeplasmatales bacterium]|nr:RNA-binding S4 domain-containing protein [Acholeplasmatales bacterium]
MRIDKYLKVTRIIKRRTLAKEVTEASRILVNDKTVKPSYNLKFGDIITILFGNKEVKVKVLSLNPLTKKADASSMYELVSEKQIEQNNF